MGPRDDRDGLARSLHTRIRYPDRLARSESLLCHHVDALKDREICFPLPQINPRPLVYQASKKLECCQSKQYLEMELLRQSKTTHLHCKDTG